LVPARYVGPSQFVDTVTSSNFLSGLQATALYTIIVVPGGLLLGLILAVVAHQKLKGMAIYRTLYSTTVVSGVAVSAVIFDTLLSPSHGFLQWLGINLDPLQIQRGPCPVSR
jgi:ABC-type sugar transport system permease subunit